MALVLNSPSVVCCALVGVDDRGQSLVRSAHLSAPIVGAGVRSITVGVVGQCGGGEHTRREIAVFVVPKLLGPNWRETGYQDQFVIRRKLHDLARRQKGPGGLLAA